MSKKSKKNNRLHKEPVEDKLSKASDAPAGITSKLFKLPFEFVQAPEKQEMVVEEKPVEVKHQVIEEEHEPWQPGSLPLPPRQGFKTLSSTTKYIHLMYKEITHLRRQVKKLQKTLVFQQSFASATVPPPPPPPMLMGAIPPPPRMEPVNQNTMRLNTKSGIPSRPAICVSIQDLESVKLRSAKTPMRGTMSPSRATGSSPRVDSASKKQKLKSILKTSNAGPQMAVTMAQLSTIKLKPTKRRVVVVTSRNEPRVDFNVSENMQNVNKTPMIKVKQRESESEVGSPGRTPYHPRSSTPRTPADDQVEAGLLKCVLLKKFENVMSPQKEQSAFSPSR